MPADPPDACRTLTEACRTLPEACRTLPDAVKPGFHGVRTHWIRGFMAFQLGRSIRTAMLVVSV
jgi:hypothetical protein